MAMTYATSGVVVIQTIVCFVYKLTECSDIRYTGRALCSFGYLLTFFTKRCLQVLGVESQMQRPIG